MGWKTPHEQLKTIDYNSLYKELFGQQFLWWKTPHEHLKTIDYNSLTKNYLGNDLWDGKHPMNNYLIIKNGYCAICNKNLVWKAIPGGGLFQQCGPCPSL